MVQRRVMMTVVSGAIALVYAVLLLTSGTNADPTIDSEEAAFVTLINDYRAQNGLGPLVLNTDLNEASDWFSNDMAADNYFPPDHIDNENPPRNPTQRVNDFGYLAGAGENIAAGNETAALTFTQWKNSPPHNTNMLFPNYTVMGIGRAFDADSTYKWYWTNNFGIVANPPTPTPGVTPTPTAGPTSAPTATPVPATATPVPTATGNAQPAIENLPGCADNSIPKTDDDSAPQFNTSFPMNFFGQTYNNIFVNNNGNVTFDSSSRTYTPFGLVGAAQKIIAAFFADVDTRGGASGQVTYGNTVYSSNRTFCANWINVGYYNSGVDKLNSFQILLIERADQGAGDFDIMMNFDKVQWEVGSANDGSFGTANGLCAQDPTGCAPARMGYSNGTVDNSFELPGSGVPGRFLDSNQNGLSRNSENSFVEGRYVYFVRNGAPTTGGTISGKVFGLNNAPQNALANSPVQLCGPPGCYTALTNAQGEFAIRGLEPASYLIRVFPGNDVSLLPAEFGPFVMEMNGSIPNLELVLQSATAPPADTTIGGRFTSGGIPVVFWGDTLPLRTSGCPGGNATYAISQGTNVIRSGQMAEGPGGVYTAAVPSLAPAHGPGVVHIEIACPGGGGTQVKDFNIYIDPSGEVRTVEGALIDAAKVTLYRAENPAGPFTQVPDGDAIMSPGNRTNPDLTNGEGHFGWDVIAGYYKVRAEKAGCSDPANPSQPYAETEVLEIPPPVTDLDIRLDCPLSALTPPFGDVDCNGAVEGKDAIQIFRYDIGLDPAQEPECPSFGGAVSGGGVFGGSIFGDLDCDGGIDASDALTILRAIGSLASALPQGCPQIAQ